MSFPEIPPETMTGYEFDAPTVEDSTPEAAGSDDTPAPEATPATDAA